MTEFEVYDALKKALIVVLPQAIKSAYSIKTEIDAIPGDYIRQSHACRILGHSAGYIQKLAAEAGIEWKYIGRSKSIAKTDLVSLVIEDRVKAITL